MVIEVTDQSFEEEVLQSDVPTEVDFWAPWCGPCKMVSPIYDKLSEEYENFQILQNGCGSESPDGNAISYCQHPNADVF